MRRQVAALSIGRIAGSASQAIVLLLLARWADPTAFGAMMIVFGITTFGLVVLDAGMAQLLARARALGQDSVVRSAVHMNTWTSASGALVGSFAVVIALGPTPTGFGAALLVCALALDKNADTLQAVPIADGLSTRVVLSYVLRRLISAALFAIAFFATLGDPSFSFGVSSLCGSVVGQIVLRYRLGLPHRSVASTPTRQLVRLGAPYLVSNMAMQSKSLDSAIVGLVSGVAASGLYAAASKFIAPFYLIPGVISQVVLPRSAQMSRNVARALLWRLLGIGAIALVLASALALFAEPLTVTVLGDSYRTASPILVWTLLGVPFFVTSSLLGSLLQGQGDASFVAANGIGFAIALLAGVALGAAIGGPVSAAVLVAASLLLKSVVLTVRAWKATAL